MAIQKSGRLRKGMVLAATVLSAGSLYADMPQRYPLDTQMVADALASRGVLVRSNQITMPMRITSAGSSPTLKIVRAERTTDGRVRLQVRCARLGECVSFLVILNVSKEEGVELLHLYSDSIGDLNQAPGPAADPAGVYPSQRPDAALLLHPGQSMVLWMEEGHVRIHIPVVALDAGKQGELIRVATADLRNTFRAIVLDAGNAEGVKE